jgi:DNA repair protein RadD
VSLLRPYQQRAVDDVVAYWRSGRQNPLVVLPTGAGKSRVLGALAGYVAARGGRALVLAHRKELVLQDAAACRIMAPGVEVGVFCAALNRREVGQITVASRDSISRWVSLLGRIDLAIVDEAHISPEKYRRLVAEVREIRPGAQCLGLTATPYNAQQGYLHTCQDALFGDVATTVGVRELLDDGYLCPIITGEAQAQIKTDGLHTRLGDFVARELECAADIDEVTAAVAADVSGALARGRTSALLFGVSVAHAHHLADALRDKGVTVGVITGETDAKERDRLIAAFRSREIQAICSMDVLTTGFDAEVVDVLAIVRPTLSTVLYVQMVGRGARLVDGKIGDLPTAEERRAAIAASSKPNCLLFDYGGNIARHGPIDNVRVREVRGKGEGEAPVKVCPKCYRAVPTGLRTCECGHEFPPPEKKANKVASKLAVIGGDVTRHTDVQIAYRMHRKRGDPTARPKLRVDYADAAGGLACEFLDIEDRGGAGESAWRWWAKRVGGEPPVTVAEAVAYLVERGGRPVAWVETRRNGKYHDVVGVELA